MTLGVKLLKNVIHARLVPLLLRLSFLNEEGRGQRAWLQAFCFLCGHIVFIYCCVALEEKQEKKTEFGANSRIMKFTLVLHFTTIKSLTLQEVKMCLLVQVQDGNNKFTLTKVSCDLEHSTGNNDSLFSCRSGAR